MESIRERTERIAHDHNISLSEALRVALQESRIERIMAARRS